jgi:uncharacterized protein YcnI
MSRLRVLPVAFVALLTAAIVGGLAGPALAHVTVSATDAVQGGEGKIVFRVPTESDRASTVKVDVALPLDTPFASVSVKPHPGWNFALATSRLAKPIMTDDGDTVTEAVGRITWTATGGGIKPGEFDEFEAAVGPLPTAASVRFDVIQTYSDGSVVRWTEDTPPGGQEPPNPAPTLTLPPAAAPRPTAAGSSAGHIDGSTALSVVALIVGSLGFGTAAAALALVRRSRVRG